MKSIKYNIISTGSKGNAVIINDFIMIDCGVSFKAISDHVSKLAIVLLTHVHSDHFRASTVKKLAAERPKLRFACGSWLVPELVKHGVNKANIDILQAKAKYDYGRFEIIPEALVHNVPNYGWHIHIGPEKIFYATDTGNLDGIEAKGYDLYMVEANYTREEIEQRILAKQEAGEFVYEHEVFNNHLDKEQTDAFLMDNMSDRSEYVYLHEHEDRHEKHFARE